MIEPLYGSPGRSVGIAGTVDVLIPVQADAAAALSDARRHEAVGRIVSRILRPHQDEDPVLATMQRISTEADARGLTPETLEAELAAHKAERTR